MTFTGENVQPNQDPLELDTLYLCSGTFLGKSNEVDYRWQGERNIWVDSGSVDIYVSNTEDQPTALSEMTLDGGDTGVNGVRELGIIPRWIAVVQNTGTTTEIVTTGIDVASKGAIA